MMRIGEAFAGLTGSGPPIVDAREAVLVKDNSTLRQFTGAQDPRVIDGDARKCRYRRG